MVAEGDTWDEVLESYEHPYRRWMPVAYRLYHVRGLLLAVAAAALASGVWDMASDSELAHALTILSAIAATIVLVHTSYVSVAAATAIRERTHDWRVQETHELAAVRARRPHAGEGEGRYAATEYAVAVGDAGDLVTWAFRPLAAHEDPAADEILLRGTPRYAAAAVDRAPYDPRDTVRAAEQLVEAQTAAAAWEAEAAHDAATARVGRQEATELAAEAASTGAALRRLTGQSPR